MPLLIVNTEALQAHTARLQAMHRSAFPVVVRQTLSDMAFDTKTIEIPIEETVFIHRKPTFFKANSKVSPARGFDVGTMAATVGFVPKLNDKSHSVQDLQQQERGGRIAGRALIAAPAARVGNSWGGNVKTKTRLANIRLRLFDSANKNLHGTKGKEGFVVSSLFAGVGGFVMNQDHSRIVEILGLSRVKGNTKIKFKVVETVEKGRQAKVQATHFMQKASLMALHKGDEFYIKNAEKQYAKL